MLNRTQTATLTSADYREAMSRMAGAVSIVTTGGPAGIRGVTVSAVVSVSDNPPTLFVCLNRNREENRFFEKNGCFALNTLSLRHLPLARAFAGEEHLPMHERFALGDWTRIETGHHSATSVAAPSDRMIAKAPNPTGMRAAAMAPNATRRRPASRN